MLGELTTAAGAAIDSGVQEAESMCNTSSACLSTHTAALTSLINASLAASEAHNKKVHDQAKETLAYTSTTVSEAKADGMSVVKVLDAVHSGAGSEKTSLDAAVSRLLKDLEAAVCNSDSSSEQIVSSVNALEVSVCASTKAMAGHTKKAIADITKTVEDVGAEVLAEIEQHFASANQHSNAQLEVLTKSQKEVDAYATEAKESILQPVGDTPRKKDFPNHLPLAATKSHEQIKLDVFARLEKERGGSRGNSPGKAAQKEEKKESHKEEEESEEEDDDEDEEDDDEEEEESEDEDDAK